MRGSAKVLSPSGFESGSEEDPLPPFKRSPPLFQATLGAPTAADAIKRAADPAATWAVSFDQHSMSAATGAASSSATGGDDTLGYSSRVAKKARLDAMLAALLSDPVLADVPKRPTLEDVDTLINLELGSAMKIAVVKMDNTSFDVAVLDTATVKDLKLAIRKKIDETQQGQLGHRHISWRHVWANFCISHHNDKLIDDGTLLRDFGIRNNSQVHFIPYVLSRASQKHSRRRKHRFFHGLSKFS